MRLIEVLAARLAIPAACFTARTARPRNVEEQTGAGWASFLRVASSASARAQLSSVQGTLQRHAHRAGPNKQGRASFVGVRHGLVSRLSRAVLATFNWLQRGALTANLYAVHGETTLALRTQDLSATMGRLGRHVEDILSLSDGTCYVMLQSTISRGNRKLSFTFWWPAQQHGVQQPSSPESKRTGSRFSGTVKLRHDGAAMFSHFSTTYLHSFQHK